MFTRTADPTRARPTGGPAPAQGPGPSAEPPPQAQAQPRRPSGPRPASILGADLAFEGRVTGDGELQVEGVVRGEVEVARLLVASGALVEGTIRSDHVEVRGRVAGDIEARTVKLYETARVEGDILHEQLSIETGAFLEGRLHRFQVAPAAAETEPQPLLQASVSAEPESLD